MMLPLQSPSFTAFFWSQDFVKNNVCFSFALSVSLFFIIYWEAQAKIVADECRTMTKIIGHQLQ